MKCSKLVIPATNVESLTWCGDTLVDWVRGGVIFRLDGKSEPQRVSWGFPFDAVRATKDSRFVVIYQRQGTKALLLREGKILRELNRSYYQAHVYEYPVCIWQAADGRTLIAHCPEEYCRIDIDDADTGTRLTEGVRKPQDFFHSRLMVNTTGTRLLSAGWAWHPWNNVVYYDVAEALHDPTHLDNLLNCAPDSFNVSSAEASSACWQTTERVLLGASVENDQENRDVEQNREPRLHARGIAIYDVVSQAYIQAAVLGDVPGTMMPLGEKHVVCFNGHPKLVSLDSGQIVARWEDLDTGNQVSSILVNTRLTPLAIDVEHHRFAVFGSDSITVIQIDLNK